MAVIPPYSFNEGLGDLIFLNPPSPGLFPSLFFRLHFHGLLHPSPLPKPAFSNARPLLVSPVMISHNRYNWGPSLLILLSHLFFRTRLFSSLVENKVPFPWFLRLFRSLWRSHAAVVLHGCPAAPGWPWLVPRVLCQLAGSTLSLACFLYSLTCPGGGSSPINVLCAAPRSLGCSSGEVSHPPSSSLQSSGAGEIILFPRNLVSSVIKSPISGSSVQQFGSANHLPDAGGRESSRGQQQTGSLSLSCLKLHINPFSWALH